MDPKRKGGGAPAPEQPSSGSIPWVGGDAALLVALRARQPEAISAVLERYGPEVHRLVARILGPDNELRDVVHSAFAHVIRNVAQVRDAATLQAWVRSIAINTARTHIRSRVRSRWLRFMPKEELPEAEAAPAADDAREVLRAMYRVLKEIPTDERVAFALRYIEGLELTEVAGECQVSLATIKRRISRAQERFERLAVDEPSLRPWLDQHKRGDQ
jgi:RNA polymerase sigma-70 factor, ECF subfamily